MVKYESSEHLTSKKIFIMTTQTQLNMLTQREQLMEDIISIVDGFLENVDIDDVDKESMIVGLCDAVCCNFPIN